MRNTWITGLIAIAAVGVALLVGLVRIDPASDRDARPTVPADPASSPETDAASPSGYDVDAFVTGPSALRTANVQRTEVAEPIVCVRVRFRLACSGLADTHYTGPLQVHVDGRPLAPIQAVNCDPVELPLPRSARLLRCDAPGCKPVELELPPPGTPPGDFVLVRFCADATLSFVVVGLPPDWQGKPSFTVASKDHDVRVLEVANWQPGIPASCAFLPGADFAWRATLRGDGSLWVMKGREVGLRVGEQRTVVVDCQDLPLVHYQVIGPSPQLLRHLVVLVQPPIDGHGWPWGVELPLSDTGRFECRGCERCTFALSVVGGFEGLREERSSECVLLHPMHPLVGLQLRDRSGQLVAFSLCGGPPKLVHVWERVHLPERLLVQNQRTGSQRILSADLPADVDLIDLDRVPGQALGTVVVTVRGSPPPSPCMLQVLRTDGSVVAAIVGKPITTFPTVDPGIYDVRWSVAGAAGPSIARQVVVQAGRTTELDAEWPAAVEWTGEIAGHLETPSARRFLNVRFGDHARLSDGTWTSIDADGRFRFGLAHEARPEATVELRSVFMNVRAELVSVDGERHHVVVRAPSDLRWVDLRVELDAGDAWVAWLSRDGREMPWMMVWSREQRPIVVPPGVVLGGALYSGGDLRGDLLAWFEVDGTRSPVVVRRAAGRTIEFRHAGATGRTLTLIGPRGQFDGGHALANDAPLRLFVPDGTRGYWLHDPQQPTERREQPLGPGDIVLVR